MSARRRRRLHDIGWTVFATVAVVAGGGTTAVRPVTSIPLSVRRCAHKLILWCPTTTEYPLKKPDRDYLVNGGSGGFHQ
jgi:hypothetical protein